jgi:HEAT repeat protein
VRVGCCRILDHFLDEDALPDLMANLSNENDEVRGWALHALACDRCKEGACRPAEDEVTPIALRMLRDDPSRRVREKAAALLGAAVHRRPEIAEALLAARKGDSHPMVRKVAGWYAPGGPIYKRLEPKQRRRRSRSVAGVLAS